VFINVFTTTRHLCDSITIWGFNRSLPDLLRTRNRLYIVASGCFEYLKSCIFYYRCHLFTIRLAQDRDRWRAVVSAMINLRVLAPRSS
jgi:hypothetical protein